MPAPCNRLRIGIVSPAGVTKRSGNARTAARYARFLLSDGHRFLLLAHGDGEPRDVLIALHAHKSAGAALQFARRSTQGRLVVVLTGTDLYRDLARSKRAQSALEAAHAIVTLHPLAARHLARHLRRKAVAIVQSATVPARARARTRGPLRAVVLGHLRAEKDPFRTAYALRRLAGEPICVTQAGAALSERFAQSARALALADSRYRWLGDIDHAAALRLLTGSDVLVLSSKMEGGANVLSEAIAAGVAVVASRIEGTLGILGPGYGGYFDVGDTAGCAALLELAVRDRAFLSGLRKQVRSKRALVAPQRERSLVVRVVERVTKRR